MTIPTVSYKTCGICETRYKRRYGPDAHTHWCDLIYLAARTSLRYSQWHQGQLLLFAETLEDALRAHDAAHKHDQGREKWTS